MLSLVTPVTIDLTGIGASLESPFRDDSRIVDVLKSQPFTLSAEVIPPRNGTEQVQVVQQIQKLFQSGAEFFSVTKGAGGSLRGGSLPIAHMIKERLKVPCIAHFTCRDLTPQEVENQLIDHHYFGIRNILALRGDPPQGQPDWKAREGGYDYAYQLIEQIRALNEGYFLSRASDTGRQESLNQVKTEFCIGAAVYPEFPDVDKRFEYFEKKVVAGAEFGLSDMLFDWESYARFLEGCEKRNIAIPILPGSRILKSRTQALKMAERFKVSIRKEWIERLPESPEAIAQDGVRIGTELFLELTEQLKRAGAPGIHLFVISDTESSCFALKQLTQAYRVTH